MATVIPSGKSVVATLQLFDASGNPTKFDADPVWSSSDTNVFSITDGTDAYSKRIRAVGPLGTAQVSATGDADIGEGVRELVVLGEFTAVAGDAVTGGFGVGPVED